MKSITLFFSLLNYKFQKVAVISFPIYILYIFIYECMWFGMSWIFVQIIDTSTHTHFTSLEYIAVCAWLPSFWPILIWLPDWNPMWLVKRAWMDFSAAGRAHLSCRSAKILTNNLMLEYFKCIHNINIILWMKCMLEFGAISISFSSICYLKFEGEERETERENKTLSWQRKWRILQNVVNLLFVFFGEVGGNQTWRIDNKFHQFE